MQTINVTATANPWQFKPSTFVVNVGDLVTLNVSVPANDPSPDGHGFLMVTYAEDGVSIPRGETRQITFAATTAGTFAFICTVASCGAGHSNMFGQMIVNAAAVPAIDVITPSSGAAGTIVVIKGTGFVAPVIVTFGGIGATNVALVDPSTIRATAPAHAAGAVDIELRTAGTTLMRPRAFAYVAPRRRAVHH